MNILKVDALAVKQGEKTVVQPLSFALQEGQSITILGETGSGKSLFVKAILGDLPASFTAEGELYLGDLPLSTLNAQQREQLWGREIAVLPQEPRLSLNPLMKIEQQVSEVYRWVRGMKRAEAKVQTECAFAGMLLDDARQKHVLEISGGMAQRCALLCAQAAGGRLLIADEPTKGLDEQSKQQVIAALREVKRRGALITITHDLQVAEALGGQLYVLRHGHWLAKEKTFEQWRSDHSDHYSQSLIRASQPSEEKPTACLAEPLLDVQQLSVGFKERTLIRELSFSLRKGEVIGFSGPSGCGKSTLADVLLGLKKPLSGSVVYHQDFPLGKRLKLYQDPPQSFAPQLSLYRQLLDLCQLHGIEPNLIERYAQQLHIAADILLRTSEQVSGGELQRIAILRVLLLKPTLLIADEPTTRLDPHIARETMELLIHTTQSIGCALILISHSHQELERYCHKRLRFSERCDDVTLESCVS
jgi:peptide/nickel transport system ATP-binding protein